MNFIQYRVMIEQFDTTGIVCQRKLVVCPLIDKAKVSVDRLFGQRRPRIQCKIKSLTPPVAGYSQHYHRRSALGQWLTYSSQITKKTTCIFKLGHLIQRCCDIDVDEKLTASKHEPDIITAVIQQSRYQHPSL